MYPYNLLNEIKKKKWRFFQRQGWTLTEYLEKYLALQTAVEGFGGATGNDPGAIAFELVSMSN